MPARPYGALMDDGQLAVAPRQQLARRFNDAMLPDEVTSGRQSCGTENLGRV